MQVCVCVLCACIDPAPQTLLSTLPAAMGASASRRHHCLLPAAPVSTCNTCQDRRIFESHSCITAGSNTNRPAPPPFSAARIWPANKPPQRHTSTHAAAIISECMLWRPAAPPLAPILRPSGQKSHHSHRSWMAVSRRPLSHPLSPPLHTVHTASSSTSRGSTWVQCGFTCQQ